MSELEELKKFKAAVASAEYQLIRNRQIEMIVGLASSNIEPLKLQGMLQLIAKTDTWQTEYDNKLKNLR